MNTVFLLLLAFLLIGLCVPKFNNWARLLLVVTISATLLFLYLT